MRKKTFEILAIVLLFAAICGVLTACADKTRTVAFISAGEEVHSVRFKGKGEVTLPAVDREGYAFEGWFLDDGAWEQPFSERYFADKAIDRDYSVYAKWRLREYVTVTFDVMGGVPLEQARIEKGVAPSLPVPVREGYTFLGWCATAELNRYFDARTELSSDVTVYAKWLSREAWRMDNRKVTVVSSGEEDREISVPYGERAGIAEPVRAGYRFRGFFTDEAFVWLYDDGIPVTSDFYLYVHWEEISAVFTVKFEENGGSEASDLTGVRYNDLISEAFTSREGYDFEGWFIDEELTRSFDFHSDRVTENMTLYAKWTEREPDPSLENTYLITFEKNGGQGEDVRRIKKGVEPTLPVPVKEGSEFVAWCVDEGLTTPYVYDPNDEKDITLYAKWNLIISVPGFTVRNSLAADGLCIVSYDGDERQVTVPDDIGGIRVVEIADGAFRESSVTKIELPRYLEIIGAYAFYGCASLTEVVVAGASLRTIGTYAFAFTGISTINFRENLTSVGEYAFKGSAVVTVTIAGAADIGYGSFSECKKLASFTAVAVRNVRVRAFENCESLTSVKLNSCISVGAYAFENCFKLTSVELDSCVELDGGAFKHCSVLADISLPKVENIRSDTFVLCFRLASAFFPSVISIESDSFKDCRQLVSVEFGDKLAEIKDGAFSDCGKTTFTVSDGNRNYAARGGSVTDKEELTLIIAGATDENGVYRVPDGIAAIAFGAFKGIRSAAEIVLSATVSDVGMSLALAENLTKITVAGGNTVYRTGSDGNLYRGTVLVRYMPSSSAEEFVFGEEVTAVAAGAFSGCKNLKEVTLNAAMTEVGFAAFYNCGSLISVKNAAHITSYGDMAFLNCERLSDIDINPAAAIGEYAFEGTPLEGA